MRVLESHSLTGLGMLLHPESAAPELANWPLHTALAVRLRYPDKQEISAIASVEEIARPGQPAVRALLLTQPDAVLPPAGTEVWASGNEPSWEQLI
ncbi:hypothetical protein [Hymenobacter amundsenii]|nr:hypothetical protein [Hymenobacter amundsenii]